jgi:coenzyme F420 hydrogenase subunit beta
LNPTVISAVVQHDLCVGCGVCAALCPEQTLEMRFNRFGEYHPFQAIACSLECGLCMRVCPFAEGNPNEDLLGITLYGNVPGIGHRPETGYFLDSYVGFASETREHGSSGGMASWFLSILIKKGVVDYVVAVIPNQDPDTLFKCSILSTPESVLDSAGSAYYPVEFSGVLQEIQNRPGKCAVIGLPCFIKAIRLATLRNKKLKEKIGITAGLACGQLKSKNYTEYISVLSGFHGQLKKIQYRGKSPLHPSTNYYYSFSGDRSPEKRIFWNDGISDAWTNRWFTPNACNFCDDVFAECADVTFMDAWLPEYSSDYQGTNLVLVRSQQVNEILRDGITSSLLNLKHIPVQDIIRSQKGVINVKKRDISYRLFLARDRNLHVPAKRVMPKRFLFHPLLRKEIELKEQMRVISRDTWIDWESGKNGGLALFRGPLDPYLSHLKRYERIRILLTFPLNVLRSLPEKIRSYLHG